MASAKGRLLSTVRGSIENGSAHYAFVRNGKQFIACIRNGWDGKMTDTQKIQTVKFANMTRVTTVVASVHANGTSAENAAIFTATRGIVNYQNIAAAYAQQPTDGDGNKQHATVRDFIAACIAAPMSAANKKIVLEAAGKPFYEETVEGYEAMKAAKNVGDLLNE